MCAGDVPGDRCQTSEGVAFILKLTLSIDRQGTRDNAADHTWRI